MRLLHSLLVMALAIASPAQSVIVVQGGGSALQQAVNTASAGDTLDVMPGTYTAVSFSRGLHFELRSGVQLVSGPAGTPAFRLTALPPYQTCVVHGGRIEHVWLINCSGAIVLDGVRMGGTLNTIQSSIIDSCTGPVVWQDCGGVPVAMHQHLSVNASSQVSLLRADTIHIDATNSNLNLVSVSCPRDAFVASFGGLRISGGRVSIAGGYFEGGVRAGAPTSDPGIVVTQQGHLVVTGGAVARAVAAFPGPPPPVSAIEVASGSVWIDPSVSSVGTGGAPPVGGAGTVVARAIPSLTASHLPQSTGYQLAMAAEPGAFLFTLLGLPQPVWSQPFGDGWLSDQSPILMINVMPASGTASFSSSLLGVPPYLCLVAQSVALTVANDVVIGVPARFVWD